MQRCAWAKGELYERYHDLEWGVPVRDDRKLFEFLILEGAQAGLSWITILQRRDTYAAAFHNFDVDRVAAMTDAELEAVLTSSGVIRNRLKVFSARKNALVFQAIQRECGSFADYLWAHVGGHPVQNACASLSDIPASTPLSDALSKDLKKRGMSFVGSTILYAYMQAIGLVNDHQTDCPRWRELGGGV